MTLSLTSCKKLEKTDTSSLRSLRTDGRTDGRTDERTGSNSWDTSTSAGVQKQMLR